MSGKSLMIVNATLNLEEPDAYEYYVSNAGAIFKKFGGMPFAKYKVSETLVGNETTKMVAVMQFPNDAAIKNVFASEEYNALVPYRDKALSSLSVFIGSEM